MTDEANVTGDVIGDVSVEERASAYGWVPQDDYRGNPETWVDAETFVKRGEEQLPIVRERNRAMEREIIDMKRTMAEFTEHHRQTREREYDRARKELADEQAKAIEGGDGERFKQLEEEKLKLEQGQAQNAAPGQPEPPEMQTFRANNAWYDSDQDMTEFADMIGFGVRNRGYTGNAFFEEVERQVKERFPQKFQNNGNDDGTSPQFGSPRSPVEGGGRSAPARGSKKTFADLPREAQQACDRFVRMSGKNQKTGKPNFTREQYLAEYDWS